MMRLFIFCAGIISMLGLTGFGDDTICIRNTDGAKVAILIHGRFDDGGGGMHRLFGPTSDSIVPLGRISGGEEQGQVMVFPENGAVEVLDGVRWSDGSDHDTIILHRRVILPVRFWVPCGSEADIRARALCAYLYAQQCLFDEHTGIELGPFRIDSIEEGSAGRGSFECVDRESLERLGHDTSAINIYYVDSVDHAPDRGTACGYAGNFIALAAQTNADILIHELGHLMTLAHTDGFQGFDAGNIMCSASNSRRYFSEGQIFRAHLDRASVLNTLPIVDPAPAPHPHPPRGGPTYAHIPPSGESPLAPRLNMRIWEDRP